VLRPRPHSAAQFVVATKTHGAAASAARAGTKKSARHADQLSGLVLAAMSWLRYGAGGGRGSVGRLPEDGVAAALAGTLAAISIARVTAASADRRTRMTLPPLDKRSGAGITVRPHTSGRIGR
jgi:hypothetical protein